MKENRLRLTKLSIRGFKSIDTNEGVDLNFGDITLLMGANGAGKSNIVSFFTMLNYMMSGGFQRYIKQYGTSQVFLHYGSNTTKAIKGELIFENDQDKDIYTFTLDYAAGDKLLITNEEVGWSHNGQDPYKSNPKGGYEESGLFNTTGETERIVKRLISECRVFQFHDSSATGPLRQNSNVESANYLRANGGNIAAFLYHLKKHFPMNYQTIVQYVRRIIPQFGDFILEPASTGMVLLKWQDRFQPDYVMLPHQLSDGSIRFIALATLLLQPEETIPNVIIIDEPELGLHPIAIEYLSEMMQQVPCSTQLIIATQSPSLIDKFTPEQVAIIEFNEDTFSTCVKRLSSEKLGVWLEDYTMSELWTKIVIEGRP